MKFSLTNGVYTTSTSQRIDCNSSELLEIPTYTPPRGRFPGGSLRLDFGTALIFKSGKIVLTGIKNKLTLDETMTTLSQLLQRQLSPPIVQNVAGCAKFDKIVNLYGLSKSCKCEYEPDLHPGVFVKNGSVRFIIYHNSAIFTGCRNENQYFESCQFLDTLINNAQVQLE